MNLPVEIVPEMVMGVVDTREQLPLDLSPLQHRVATLDTGDYSVFGLEHVIRIERKSEDDLLACCGRERKRFDREIQRLLAYPVRALVIESTWDRIEQGDWRSQLKPHHVLGSLLGWIAMGLPVVMADDRARAGCFVSRILFTAARRRYRECRTLLRANP